MPSPKAKREIAVFIASPGDLEKERKQFRTAIEILNSGFGVGRFTFEALGWEDTLASTGPRSQSVINQEVDRCDVFFLIMHRRWGQETPDENPYDSYTEEEYSLAFKRWEKTGSPSIFVFFKRVEAAQEADAGPQLKKVIAFRKRLENTRKVLYRTIDDGEDAFLKEVDQHLMAYALDELPKADRPRKVLFPQSAIEEINRLKAAIKVMQSEKGASGFTIAENEVELALESKLEQARAKFVSLIGNTDNIRILALAEDFFTRTDDVKTSLEILERWIALVESEKDTRIQRLTEDRDRVVSFLELSLKRPIENTLINAPTSNLTMNFNMDLKIELPKLQGQIDDIKGVLLEAFPNKQAEIEAIQKDFDKLPVDADKEQLLDSSVGPRLKRLIEKGLKGEKALEATAKGIGHLQKLGKTYNGIAQWVGWPQVPQPLLGSGKDSKTP